MEGLVFGSPVHQRQPTKHLASPAPVLPRQGTGPAVCGAIASSQPFLFEEGQLDTFPLQIPSENVPKFYKPPN